MKASDNDALSLFDGNFAPIQQPSSPPPHGQHVMLVITKGEAGGAQSHVLALCEALCHQFRFTVVIGGPVESVLGQQLRALGITVFPMPELLESLLPWRLLPAIQRLQTLIQQLRPGVVHAHSSIAGVVARVAAHQAPCPVVYTVHGFGFKPQVPWLRRHVAHLAERVLARWTTQLICVSGFERELAYRLPIDPRRVHVIRNGLPRLPQTLSALSPAAEPTLPAHLPRLIMVARMKAPKRHDLLLRALASVRDILGQEMPVTLAGSGPLLAAHQALAKQLDLHLVTWAGDVDTVSELLHQHDVFVLLSDHEGMPITILEAMRAGLPVVASDLPGIREQLRHNQEGLLCAATAEDVAHQLLRFVREPHLAKNLGRAAQRHFENHFSINGMAREVQQLYLQCIDNTAPTPSPRPADHAVLMSAQARRRDALLGWSLWGTWLLLPSLMLAQMFQDTGLVTYQFAQTIWWCVIPYAIASHLLMRNAQLPSAERGAMLWASTLAPFMLTPLGFALLQQPYSRAAVAWSYVVTTLWLWWGYRYFVKHKTLRLLYLDTEVPHLLAQCLTPQPLDDRQIQLSHWDAANPLSLPPCDGVILDSNVPSNDDRIRLLGQLKMQHHRLYGVETVAELLSGRTVLPTQHDTLWEIDNDPAYDRIKRLLDVSVVLLTSPLWLTFAALVALAVRYDSPGPAFYKQERVGRNGRVFKLWKFRSMVHERQDSGVHFAQADDPRVTRFGKFIRRTRLDELPQLWNVLRGDMSLIGPRPEQAPFVREFATTIPCYPYRHLVRPGLTGWAQVQQGYADSTDATRIKLSYDLYYVTHYSLALDLLIAFKTIKTVCTGFGAR